MDVQNTQLNIKVSILPFNEIRITSIDFEEIDYPESPTGTVPPNPYIVPETTVPRIFRT